jgi:predicted phage tail component-like protein
MDLYDDPVLIFSEGARELTYGGVDIGQYFRGWTITRSVIPSVNVEELVIPGRDGVILNGHRTEALTLTLTGALNAHDRKTVEAIRQRLGRLLLPQFSQHDGLKNLYFGEKFYREDYGNHYIYYRAIVRGTTELERSYAYPHVSIEFYVPDGCGYDSWPMEADLTGSTSIVPKGNMITWPSIQVLTRTSGDLVITANSMDGGYKHITTDYAYPFTIDCKNEKITAENGPIRFDLDSDFFPLYPYEANTIKISGGTAKIYWRERYV